MKPPRPSLAEKLTFFPAPYPAGDWQPEGLDFEDCWFETGDGLLLHGWFVPHDRPRGVLLFAHGNAGNLSGRAEVVRLLNSRLALSVMIFDYRGYGRSEGVPTVEGILRDARAAHDYLVTEKQVSPGEMLLLGRSIGGAVMVDLAAERGARGLILESTFTSLREAAFHHYPRFLVRAAVPDRLNSIDRIRDYDGPVFISHGDADRVVPYAHGEELFEAAGEPKRFFPIPGGDHNDPPPEEYYRELERFLESL